MMERILLCKPRMSGREIDYIKDALAEDWAVPLGPDVTAFEKELGEYLGTDHVVALNAGTSAIHLALLALGVGQGDEVIAQSMTFAASVNPIRYVGATPVLIDSEPRTWNMNPELLEEVILDRERVTGQRPKAILPVALYGMPYEIGRIMEVAGRYGIPVVEDAAEGLGSEFEGRKLGTFGQYGALSFNGNKIITTSGGGALICPDAEAAARVKFLATQAREPFPYYQHEVIGYNYRLSNISACIGRAQLEVLPEYLAHHRMVQDLYQELLKDVAGVEVHGNPDSRFDSNFWLCTILLGNADCGTLNDGAPDSEVEALRRRLDEARIETRPLWKPMYDQPVYADAPAYRTGVSDLLFRRGLCLPAGPYVTPDNVRYIADIIRSEIK
ncbi:MAG: aminotransferase [Bacteroides sp.]|nr:aminotransferase [Bacteroides sp.]